MCIHEKVSADEKWFLRKEREKIWISAMVNWDVNTFEMSSSGVLIHLLSLVGIFLHLPMALLVEALLLFHFICFVIFFSSFFFQKMRKKWHASLYICSHDHITWNVFASNNNKKRGKNHLMAFVPNGWARWCLTVIY